MAMQSGNVVVKVAEKSHGGEAKTGVQQWWQHQNQQQQVMDERDGFISWLRGEFAAANAMIDALCHHLRATAEAGEYDGVIGCIQQRRCNWNSVLHMQQYFSVAEVIYALQQVGWKRQQQRPNDGYVKGGKDFKRGGRWQRGGFGNASKDVNENENVEEKNGEEKKDLVTSPQVDGSIKSSETTDGDITGGSECKPEVIDKKCASNSKGLSDFENAVEVSSEKQTITPRTFVATELCDGKTVNVVDGLKLYENLIDSSEVSKLVTLVNDLRAAGRRGQFQGQTFVVSKRPMKGHGREMIQLGIPLADSSDDEAGDGTSKDPKLEPIPGLLQDVIERLLAKKVISVKPDSCIIDIFNEGDHSQPHMWPHWFGRPVSVLFLTGCEMTFGKVIEFQHPGGFRGSFKMSLGPGSMLVMQGRSADFAKHAIASQRKQRILVTLTKSQPKRITAGDYQHMLSSGTPPPSHSVPPPSRSPNHIRHPVGLKHYGPLPTAGVLPALTACPQLPPPNGIQPIFVAAPVAPPMPFLAPVSGGWPAATPRHPPPSLHVPGTGVFLPPGSGTLNPPLVSAPATEESSTKTAPLSQREINSSKLNGHSALPEGQDGEVQQEDCNGSLDGAVEKKSLATEEQHQDVDSQVAAKPAGAV